MARRTSTWLRLFQDFVTDLRITSKEANSSDERGVKLEMWRSQRMFLEEVGSGLDAGIHSFNCGKSRQLGITTISLALVDVFWMAMHSNMIGCLVSDTEKNRDVNRRMIERYVASFPEGYFGDDFKIVSSNRTMLTFSNGCRLDLLVAGVKKKSTAWGEGVGYALCHATEVASYADPEGLKSLEEGFAQQNPDRLFVYESTSKGFNHWRSRWYQGAEDKLSQRSFFIGWWAGDTNIIPRSDPRFIQYGARGPDQDEKERIRAVAQLYGVRITPEQLAWYRWKEQRAAHEQDLFRQNQPWTIQESFVSTGYSFFQIREIDRDLKKMDDAAREWGDENPYRYKGYRYNVDGDFYNFSMEQETEDKERVELRIWEEPVPHGRYVIGMDPAYGRNDHKDASCISVWRCYADRIVQVAEFTTADMEVKHAAWVLFHLCAAYRDSMANVELQGPGRLVMMEFNHLRELLGAESNQAKTEARGWSDAAAQARWYLYKKVDTTGGGYALNFEASWKTVKELMHDMRGTYVSRELVIRSWPLLKEMQNVVVVDGNIGAPESTDENMKDDRVYAAALAIRGWREWIRREMLAAGDTYEVVTKRERGEESKQTKMIDSLVHRFLVKKMAEADMPKDTRDPWLVKQGLV